jgi:hypothetical protein
MRFYINLLNRKIATLCTEIITRVKNPTLQSKQLVSFLCMAYAGERTMLTQT